MEAAPLGPRCAARRWGPAACHIRAADSVLRDSPPSESRTPTCSCAVLRLLRRLCVSVASGLGGPPASPLHCPRASLHVRAPESSADTSELARGAHGPAHGVRARTASHSEPSMLPEGCCGFATVGHGAKTPGVTVRPGSVSQIRIGFANDWRGFPAVADSPRLVRGGAVQRPGATAPGCPAPTAGPVLGPARS